MKNWVDKLRLRYEYTDVKYKRAIEKTLLFAAAAALLISLI